MIVSILITELSNKEYMTFIYVLAVVIVSRITSGYLWGVIASVASVVGVNFLFVYPVFEIDFLRSGYPITFLSMLIVSIITSAMTVQIKEQARVSNAREARTNDLYQMAKQLLITHDIDKIVQLTLDNLNRITDCSVAFYLDNPSEKQVYVTCLSIRHEKILHSASEQLTASWVYDNKERAGSGTDICTNATGLYMPVVFQNKALGVIGLLTDSYNMYDKDTITFLEMITAQVAMAIDRQRLSDQQQKTAIEAEREKMRSNLLRAISHDIRTPLTGILGASSTMLENKNVIDENDKDRLLMGIKEDSQWLIRMVENLLSVTRISGDTTNFKKSPELVEEFVGEAVGRIKSKFKNSRIKVRVPEELLMVPVDATLIEQVIINLIENSVKHSGMDTNIDVIVRLENDFAIFEISDDGKGIPKENIPYLFEGYSTNSSIDTSRGMGIGLSICMSIVKAHGGEMSADNKVDGGAIFTFKLPLESESLITDLN